MNLRRTPDHPSPQGVRSRQLTNPGQNSTPRRCGKRVGARRFKKEEVMQRKKPPSIADYVFFLLSEGNPTELVLRHDLRIGRAVGGENEMFSALRSVQADVDGNIYVLDGKEARGESFRQRQHPPLNFRQKRPGSWRNPDAIRLVSPAGMDFQPVKVFFFRRSLKKDKRIAPVSFPVLR